MYRIPLDLDLSGIVGEVTTQVSVGQFDLQFDFGPVHFNLTSCVKLLREGRVVAEWVEGRWPGPEFFDVMNARVVRWQIPDERRIVIELENGLTMQLEDDSDQYETMVITMDGGSWVI